MSHGFLLLKSDEKFSRFSVRFQGEHYEQVILKMSGMHKTEVEELSEEIKSLNSQKEDLNQKIKDNEKQFLSSLKKAEEYDNLYNQKKAEYDNLVLIKQNDDASSQKKLQEVIDQKDRKKSKLKYLKETVSKQKLDILELTSQIKEANQEKTRLQQELESRHNEDFLSPSERDRTTGTSFSTSRSGLSSSRRHSLEETTDFMKYITALRKQLENLDSASKNPNQQSLHKFYSEKLLEKEKQISKYIDDHANRVEVVKNEYSNINKELRNKFEKEIKLLKAEISELKQENNKLKYAEQQNEDLRPLCDVLKARVSVFLFLSHFTFYVLLSRNTRR